MVGEILLALSLGVALALGQQACPGYSASNVQKNSNSLTANLILAGEACNVFGTDLPNLTLTVEYQSGKKFDNAELHADATK